MWDTRKTLNLSNSKNSSDFFSHKIYKDYNETWLYLNRALLIIDIMFNTIKLQMIGLHNVQTTRIQHVVARTVNEL